MREQPKVIKSDEELDSEEDISEFSSVGAIAGVQLPLGMSPNDPEKKKRNSNRN